MSCKDILRGGARGSLPSSAMLNPGKVFPERDHFGARSHRYCSPSTSGFRHTFNAQFKSSLSKLNVSKSAVWDQCAICFGFLREGEKEKKIKCWNRLNSCQSREIVPQLFGQPHVYLGTGPCEWARREVSLCSEIISSSFRRKERLWAVLGAGHERLEPQPDLPPLQPNAFAQHPRLALPLLTSMLLLDYVRCKPAF